MVVPASGGDESLSAGACFAASIEHEHRAQPIRHVYLGQTPGSDWQVGIIEAGHTTDEYLVCEGVQAEEIAALLAADVIVARCVGPSEFGARALGNRSILANPANAANLKTINDAIKNRDFWMPFTPSILEEHIDMYMLNPKSLDVPYMTIGFETTDAARTDLAAALHPGDFSARPQAVKKSTNPEYWALIEAFRQKTGIPALLNTSLNLHGEPMNYSIAQAARTVAKSELQVLVMPDNRLLYKQGFADALEAIWGRSKTALA
jgi:carbamoyltransferase